VSSSPHDVASGGAAEDASRLHLALDAQAPRDGDGEATSLYVVAYGMIYGMDSSSYLIPVQPIHRGRERGAIEEASGRRVKREYYTCRFVPSSRIYPSIHLTQ
jgi:hypothetical protein